MSFIRSQLLLNTHWLVPKLVPRLVPGLVPRLGLVLVLVLQQFMGHLCLSFKYDFFSTKDMANN